jgi:single-strand DNA-binding protein
MSTTRSDRHSDVAGADGTGDVVNEVRLVGRVSSAPVERELPSGARVVTFRLVLRRERTAMTAGSKQSSDWVDCAAWAPRTRRTAGRLVVGDEVEVRGAIRRRFFRTAAGSGSRVEVEMLQGRRLHRSTAA